MMSDQKDSVTMGVNLSSQLITVALGMIAVLGAFATFVMDKRDVGFAYYLLIFIAFLCFIFSIRYGGQGINIARNNGFKGIWELKPTKEAFNKQAIVAFLGIIFFLGSIFICILGGKEKTDEFKSKIASQERAIIELKLKDSINTLQIFHFQETLDSLLLHSSKSTTYIPYCVPICKSSYKTK